MRHGLGAVLTAGPLIAAVVAAGPVEPLEPGTRARLTHAAVPQAASADTAGGSAGGVPHILLWKPAGVLSSSPDSILALLTALGEDVLLTSNLHAFGPDLNVHECVWVFAGIYPNNHILNDPEGLALDSFAFDGGLLVVEGGDCFNHDPEEFGAYDIRPIFGLLGGPDGTRDIFHVSGLNDLLGFEFQYIGPNRFTDDLVVSTSIPVFRNSANQDIVSVFNAEYGGGRAFGFTFESGRLIDVPSAGFQNTKLELLSQVLHLLRDELPPVLLTTTTAIAETLAAGDSTIRTFEIANPGSINQDLIYSIAETPPASWLATVPTNGVLEGNGVATIQTLLFAQALAPGQYSTNLTITSNDPLNPTDVVVVSLLVQPPPDLLIEPSTLAFTVAAQGGTDEDSLSLRNIGGSVLEYTLAIDDGGAVRTEFPSQILPATGGNRYRGNVYRITNPVPLKRIEHRVNVAGSTSFEFFVYQGEDSVAVFTKIFSQQVSIGPESDWAESGPIHVPLTAGDYFFIGAAWQGSITYYSDGGSTPLPAAVPFGVCLGSASGNVFPSPPTKFVAAAPTLSSQALEFGETGEVSILDALGGSLAPNQATIINLRATGEAVTGLLPASLLVTSNDPTRFIQTVQTVPITVFVVGSTGAPEAGPPGLLALGQNVPNPFRGSTTIHFALPSGESAKLRIYDLSGRLVRTLLERAEGSGEQQVVWDGRDARGVEVSAGVYFYSLETGTDRIRRKSVVVR